MENRVIEVNQENILNNPLSSVLNSAKVQFNWGQWEEQESEKVILLIKEWRTEQLYLNHNFYEKIIHSISHIKFTHLRILDIGSNKINTVESLSRFNLPILQHLYLCTNDQKEANNQLTSLKVLIKMYLPQCKHFLYSKDFIKKDDNKIQDGEFICMFASKQLNLVQLEAFKWDEIQNNDLRWAVKASAKLQCLMFESRERIGKAKMETCLGKRFLGIEFSAF